MGEDLKSLVKRLIPEALTYKDMQEGVQVVTDATDKEEKDFSEAEREMAITTAFQIVTMDRVEKHLGRSLTDSEIPEVLDIVSADLEQYTGTDETDTRDSDSDEV